MSQRRYAQFAVLTLFLASVFVSITAGSAAAAGYGSTTSHTFRLAAPTGLTVGAVAQTSVALEWTASSDHAAGLGYTIYRNGVAQGTTTGVTYAVAGLACGTTYSFAVDAYDAAGDRSDAATISAPTAPCPAPPPARDTTPPTTPTGLAVGAIAQTSLTLSWHASTDAVGVAGYTIFEDGASQGTTTGLTHTFEGLGCGRTYSLAVEAFDAAGNRSAPAGVSASTAACAPPPPVPSGSGSTGSGSTGGSAGSGSTGGSTGSGSSGGSTGDSSGGSTGGSSAPGVAVWVSPAGNDGSCVRGNPALPCATYQRAYALARTGDSIQVAPGTYPATNPAGNAIEINGSNPSLTGYVTFVCAPNAGADTVDEASNAFNVAIRADWVAFRGSCFHFRVLHVNYSGDSGVGADHVLIDDVHMDSFQLSGAHDTTIENSQIGPALMCYAPGQGTAATQCRNYAAFPGPWQTVAQWWSRTPTGGTGAAQLEPYIHDRGNGSDSSQCSTNVTISGDTFHDLQSTDSAVNHTGGLLIDGSPCQSWDHNLVIERSVFEHNMSYGIEMDGPMSGSTIENNWIGQGFGALGTGGALTLQQDAGRGDGLESGCRGGAHKVSDMLIRYNSVGGYMTVNGNGDSAVSGCWSNVRIIGNIYANSAFGGVDCGGINSSYTQVTMDYNAVASFVCGSHGLAIGSLPFVSNGPPLNFALAEPVPLFVPDDGSSYFVGSDFFGAARTYATQAGAVGP